MVTINVGPDRPEIKPSTRPSHKVRKTQNCFALRLAYERFLADPQPAARWVLAGSKKLARGHPDWRPFAGPLSPGSVRQALVIPNALFA